MFYANTFTLKMENKKMAAKALEVMREALAQIDADGFKYGYVTHLNEIFQKVPLSCKGLSMN